MENAAQKIILGIDPGLNGGMCFLDEDGKIVTLMKTPVIGGRDYDIQEMDRAIEEHAPTYAWIEQQVAMPGQGLSSTLQTGKGFGILLGLMAARKIPHQVVMARQWQTKMFTGINGKLDTKEKSIVSAKRLFPTADFRRSALARIPDDGLTDAANIAECARRSFFSLRPQKFDAVEDAGPPKPHKPMKGNEEVCCNCGRLIAIDTEGCV